MPPAYILVYTKYRFLVSVQIRKKRLGGYVRVSTDSEDQKTSFEAQYEEYYNRINSNPEWEFVFHLIPPAYTCIITKYNFLVSVHENLHKI